MKVPPPLICAWLLALAGCAATPATNAVAPGAPPPPAPIGWEGQLNARGGNAHPAPFQIVFVDRGEELAGRFTMPGDSCLPEATFGAYREGATIHGAATAPGVRLVMTATVAEGMIFGTYSFERGDCVGDWGSLAATALSR